MAFLHTASAAFPPNFIISAPCRLQSALELTTAPRLAGLYWVRECGKFGDQDSTGRFLNTTTRAMMIARILHMRATRYLARLARPKVRGVPSCGHEWFVVFVTATWPLPAFPAIAPFNAKVEAAYKKRETRNYWETRDGCKFFKDNTNPEQDHSPTCNTATWPRATLHSACASYPLFQVTFYLHLII